MTCNYAFVETGQNFVHKKPAAAGLGRGALAAKRPLGLRSP